jgi:hypothetical protein
VPRNLSSDVLAALAAGNIQPFYLAAIQFSSGVEYIWTGVGNLSWNAHTWQGVGTFGGVSAITQTDELNAESITLTLSGVPTGFISSALSECRQNYTVDVWLGLLSDSGAVIVDPVHCFSGTMDVPSIQDGGDTVTISITAENELIALQRASNRRYTNDDQKIDFPNDNGFQFVPLIQEWNGQWGKPGGGLFPGAFAQLIFGPSAKHNID